MADLRTTPRPPFVRNQTRDAPIPFDNTFPIYEARREPWGLCFWYHTVIRGEPTVID